MEENKNTAPVSGESGNGQGEHRARRRGHRGGKKHNKHRTENAARENAGENASRQPQKNEQQQPPKQNQPQQNGGQKKNDNKGRDGRGKKNRGGKQNPHTRDHITQKDDIYGDPKEERELAEWRAKIVLNAQSAKATTPDPEEPVEIPEGTDLFASPVMAQPTSNEAEEKVEVVGIRFRSAGKMYYFAPGKLTLKKGDAAIVETARGPEFGDVCMGNTMISAKETVSPLRPILRAATEEDVAHNEQNRQKEKEALGICQKKIEEHKLEMKLIEVQYAFDNSKLLFYFSSEGRVDFRELVKDLASVFHTRIELRQIGIRDEAKMLGGFGACGRVLCCSTFLPDFAQVSIKMAKEQGLSLNSTKISGLCGRLMCCLRFESDVYSAEHKLTPPVNSTVKTEDGIGTVISTNPLAGTVRVIFKDQPDTPPKQYHRNTVTVIPKDKPRQDSENADKDEQ